MSLRIIDAPSSQQDALAADLTPRTLMTTVTAQRDTIPNGALLQVRTNQMLLLVEDGKIIDFTAVPGWYKVDNFAPPLLLHGEYDESLRTGYQALRYEGMTPMAQKAVYLNTSWEDMAFDSLTELHYFDAECNAELFFRLSGSYSVQITDPLAFYGNRTTASSLTADDWEAKHLAEFINCLQATLESMAAELLPIAALETEALIERMREDLADIWQGVTLQSLSIQALAYDEASAAALANRAVVESEPIPEPLPEPEIEPEPEPQLIEISAPEPIVNPWFCACGRENGGQFCPQCGRSKPKVKSCASCRTVASSLDANYCSHCGRPI